ncbi:bis(5'-adenosyl)-triphosphatase [Monocercomonoides exilis]|uniref:bis(5'-adenosyl)-triphosphatase n=1 Tax=Monocercomonoides exilis TaxID=2049356 RepID=UPI0035595E8B|nr:bis(5'-adenosyl)-triphosphatase [Monocercomonoides exilis]|eukprot:MONOS_12748.1-p1 / transcript=MONOS_12748.1 / gene=MONOS_12748 / organism=Monocercomonoides_exilis_PA203 / gene_product=bis(5'-adenosyl)-triphosphatase [EC:3.6.1.29] / transcript_product=bis(5'-adenosyl)-triphosphatase [EC:3.6.1.29] / location=Mono_scaffold00728:31584-32215(+) / protein_length=158 / sequence_SO=supercontig / SO=protein_coding / is_pseudo=false
MEEEQPSSFLFSKKIVIPISQVFFLTPLSFAFVNIRPVHPGHILIAPRRIVERYCQLTAEEVVDIAMISYEITDIIEKTFGCSSTSLTIQDGVESGQSVNHVHLHIIPVKKEYGEMQVHREIEKPRPSRSAEEMAEEAKMLRPLFRSNPRNILKFSS